MHSRVKSFHSGFMCVSCNSSVVNGKSHRLLDGVLAGAMPLTVRLT